MHHDEQLVAVKRALVQSDQHPRYDSRNYDRNLGTVMQKPSSPTISASHERDEEAPIGQADKVICYGSLVGGDGL